MPYLIFDCGTLVASFFFSLMFNISRLIEDGALEVSSPSGWLATSENPFQATTSNLQSEIDCGRRPVSGNLALRLWRHYVRRRRVYERYSDRFGRIFGYLHYTSDCAGIPCMCEATTVDFAFFVSMASVILEKSNRVIFRNKTGYSHRYTKLRWGRERETCQITCSIGDLQHGSRGDSARSLLNSS